MPHKCNSGFTAVEVFLVLTMLALVVGLMIVPAYRLLDAFKTRPLETTILSTIRKAHMLARADNRPVLLSYQSTSNRFQLCTQEGVLLESIPIDSVAESDSDGSDVTFYRLLPEDPKDDEFVYELEEDPVDIIWFHPCGVSIPFAVQFEVGGDEYCLVLDPFSSKPVLRRINGDAS